jgi:hypothetical protein
MALKLETRREQERVPRDLLSGFSLNPTQRGWGLLKALKEESSSFTHLY